MSEKLHYEILEKNGKKIGLLNLKLLPPNNTLNFELMQKIKNTFNEMEKTIDGLIVFSENERFFSNGLDGKFLFDSNSKMRIQTISEMISFFKFLILFKKPWIVEITGYAMAGGAVIASAADYRFMLNKGRIGFTEPLVGLALPISFISGLESFVLRSAIRNLAEGYAYKPEEAKSIGLIDEIVESKEKLREMSLKKLDKILKLSQTAYLRTRNGIREKIAESMEKSEVEDIKMASELIVSEQFQEIIQNIVGKN